MEHLVNVEIVDIDLRPEMLSITTKFEIDPELQGDFAGLALGGYAAIEADEPFALSAHVDLRDADGITQVYLLIREWVGGGEFVGQATRLVEMAPDDAPPTLVVRTGRAAGHVVHPALAFRRAPGAAATGFVTIRKLVFGSLYQHPEWIG